MRAILFVCKKAGCPDDLTEFRKQSGDTFSQLPIPCKPVLPSRRAEYVYQVFTFVFFSPSIPTGSPQACIYLHFEPVLACTEMLQLRLGPDCFKGDRDKVVWVPVKLQCLCLAFHPIAQSSTAADTNKQERILQWFRVMHVQPVGKCKKVQRDRCRLSFAFHSTNSFMHILMHAVNVSECENGLLCQI